MPNRTSPKNSHPATKKDLAAVKNELKEDVAAVKKELKEDISGLNQKFNILDQKVGTLDQKVNKVAAEVVRTQDQMRQMEDRLSKQITDMKYGVFKVVDDFMAKTEKVDRRHVITSHRVDELEKRVVVLESKQ